MSTYENRLSIQGPTLEFVIARKRLVESQVRPNNVTDPSVISAFATVEREAFLPKSKQAIAYSELELPTTAGRALWAARDQSKLLQAMDLESSDLALVIGAAEGYSAALIGQIVETVIALESDDAVTDETTDRLLTLGHDKIACVTGSLEAGYPSEGPYDAIYVNGSVSVVPDTWLSQLAVGGRLGVVVREGDRGSARIYTTNGTTTSYRSVFECVPPHLSELDPEPDFTF